MLSEIQKLKYPFGGFYGSQPVFLAITLLSDSYIVLEHAGYTTFLLWSTVEFISNLIEHERNAIISQYHIRFCNWFVYHQFSQMYKKLSWGNVYKSCCYMGILILSLYPNVVLERIVHVSFDFDNVSKIGSSSILRTSVIFRYFAPRILKIVEMQRSTH